VFDFAVQAGPARSIKTLQAALGEKPDGRFDSTTLEAVWATDSDLLVEDFTQAKGAFYRALPTFKTFGRGWLYRLAEVKLNATSMMG